jgi:hypothetical protein
MNMFTLPTAHTASLYLKIKKTSLRSRFRELIFKTTVEISNCNHIVLPERDRWPEPKQRQEAEQHLSFEQSEKSYYKTLSRPRTNFAIYLNPFKNPFTTFPVSFATLFS